MLITINFHQEKGRIPVFKNIDEIIEYIGWKLVFLLKIDDWKQERMVFTKFSSNHLTRLLTQKQIVFWYLSIYLVFSTNFLSNQYPDSFWVPPLQPICWCSDGSLLKRAACHTPSKALTIANKTMKVSPYDIIVQHSSRYQ